MLLAGPRTPHVLPGHVAEVYFHEDVLIRYEGENIAHK